MGVAIVTGSAGLIGSEAVRHFAEQGMIVVGVDNDMLESFTSPGLTRTCVVPILTTPPPGMPMALRRVPSALARGSEPVRIVDFHGDEPKRVGKRDRFQAWPGRPGVRRPISGDLIEDR